PDFRDLRQIEIVLVMLRVSQRRGFCIDRAGFLANIGGLEHPKTFGISRHHPVFDAVMDHFDEMAGTMRSTMHITLLRRTVDLYPAKRARNMAAAWRKRTEYWIDVLPPLVLAAVHHAIAAYQSPVSAARADVEIMNPLGCEVLGPANVIDVIGIAAVNQNI